MRNGAQVIAPSQTKIPFRPLLRVGPVGPSMVRLLLNKIFEYIAKRGSVVSDDGIKLLWRVRQPY